VCTYYAYTVLHFNPLTLHSIFTPDQTPRELHLTVFRSGDSVGIISIDYSIVYLPAGVTDPIRGNSSVVTMATGSVQLQSGQVSKELNVTISEDAFLEPRANFYAYLNSTMLMGGGTYTCI